MLSSGFVANEHIDHSSVSVIAGAKCGGNRKHIHLTLVLITLL